MKPTQKPFIVQFIEKLAVYRSVSIETILTEIHLRQVDWEEIIGGSRSLTSTEREKLAEVFEMPDSLILLLNTRSPNILVQSIQKGVIGSFAKYTIGTMLCLREPGLGGALKLIRDIRKMTQAEVGQRVWSVEDVVFWEKTTCDASMLGDNGLSQFANALNISPDFLRILSSLEDNPAILEMQEVALCAIVENHSIKNKNGKE